MTDQIKTKEDAEKLQALIAVYTKQHTGADLPFIDIVKAFNKLVPFGSHGFRVFYALVDLKINFALLLLDSFFSGAHWNEQNSMKLSVNESILDNPTLFNSRLEIHRHNANYIPRYRAMWDKIMGVLLLISSEELYNKYNSSKSRKKAFRNLSQGVSFLDKGFVDQILEHIQKFDDNFRTPEVHRFGSLRKYSFMQNPFDKIEYAELRGSWNYIITILAEIDRIIDAIKEKSPANKNS
ncbi:hypothetical protein [Pontibacter harenae]|uniref:hypothetical protein n=1 Tax=Pontibacter harenae TaxID=2894083 RepID=UPI001E4F5A03|nr:hypothetical protein [Pontibacter harenae]MCC9168960.1 hypothetical protein [Pontibacter harenae]